MLQIIIFEFHFLLQNSLKYSDTMTWDMRELPGFRTPVYRRYLKRMAWVY